MRTIFGNRHPERLIPIGHVAILPRPRYVPPPSRSEAACTAIIVGTSFAALVYVIAEIYFT